LITFLTTHIVVYFPFLVTAQGLPFEAPL